MKAFLAICCSVTVVSLVALGYDIIRHQDPNYSLQQEFKSKFVGGDYSVVRKIAMTRIKLVSSENGKETFAGKTFETGEMCYSTFTTKDGKITDFSLSGQCARN